MTILKWLWKLLNIASDIIVGCIGALLLLGLVFGNVSFYCTNGMFIKTTTCALTVFLPR